jgi:hypothetical protein
MPFVNWHPSSKYFMKRGVHLRVLLFALPLWWLAPFAGAAVAGGRAEEPTAKVQALPRVLFVGNSLIFGSRSPLRYYRNTSVADLNGTGMGGVPALFKAFASQAGLDFAVSHETVGGSGLDLHLKDKADIIGRPWEFVVLLSFSLLDREKPGDPELLKRSVLGLSHLFHASNPQVDIRVIATMARADQVYPPDGHWHGRGLKQMTLDIRTAYNQAAAGAPLVRSVIPVGEAWMRAINNGVADANPYDGIGPNEVNLWAYDHRHGSVFGYYLQSLVIFGDLTGLDPRSLGEDEQTAFDLGISKAQSSALQQIAYEELSEQNGGRSFATFQRMAIPHP